ncbi:MAG: hypothetical protein H0T10_00255, partial [Actinobacteria bacterium]|nr:hypothetical protein [Actinomycetota bacterium]
HELLTAEEQRLFARLAVFRGGCTLGAAEEVTEADLDTVQSLLDKSLLRQTQERFWMLETIREYAAERLEESGEAEKLRRRHAVQFLALAEEAEPNLRGSPGEWLGRLEREHDNLRAALDTLEASGESERALRLAGALWKFWDMRGHVAEGGRRLERALATDERPTAARAKSLNGATALALAAGDLATARLRAEEALALQRTLGDAWGTANSRFLLGNVAAVEHDWVTGQQLFEESVRVFEELGDEHYTLLATRALAWMCEELGDLERFRVLTENYLRGARATGNQRLEARALGVLAGFAVNEGRTQDALSMLKEVYRIDRAVGDVREIADDLCRFGQALAAAGRAGTAARLLSSSEGLRQQIGAGAPSYIAEMNAKTLATIHAHLDAATFAEAWQQGQALTPDEAVALALDSLD